ncbi:hypothetical protein GCM10029963_44970 [Micromonospora andamanensis]
MPTEDVVLAGRLGPLEVVRGREDVVPLTSTVQVGGCAVDVDPPPQHPDVLGPRPGLEHRQQPAVDPTQLQQPGLPVVAVQLTEVPDELRVAEQAGQLVVARFVEPEPARRRPIVPALAGFPGLPGSRVNRCREKTSSTEVSGFNPMKTLYPNSISPPTETMSRGTQLCSVRIRSVLSSRSSVLPKTSSRRALSASARRASSPAWVASRRRSTS